MDKYDVAGLLTTYSYQIVKEGNDTKRLRDFVKELKGKLDLRKIKQSEKEE